MSNCICLPYDIINNILNRIKIKHLIGDEILEGYIIKHFADPHHTLLYALIKKKRYNSVVLYLKHKNIASCKYIQPLTALRCILSCISINIKLAEHLFQLFKHNLCNITNTTFISIFQKLISAKFQCPRNELNSFLHKICDWAISNDKHIQLPLFIIFNIFKHKYGVQIFDILIRKKHCILRPLLSLDINDTCYAKHMLTIIQNKLYNVFRLITKQKYLSNWLFQFCLASNNIKIICMSVTRYKPRFYI